LEDIDSICISNIWSRVEQPLLEGVEGDFWWDWLDDLVIGDTESHSMLVSIKMMTYLQFSQRNLFPSAISEPECSSDATEPGCSCYWQYEWGNFWCGWFVWSNLCSHLYIPQKFYRWGIFHDKPLLDLWQDQCSPSYCWWSGWFVDKTVRKTISIYNQSIWEREFIFKTFGQSN